MGAAVSTSLVAGLGVVWGRGRDVVRARYVIGPVGSCTVSTLYLSVLARRALPTCRDVAWVASRGVVACADRADGPVRALTLFGVVAKALAVPALGGWAVTEVFL